MYAGAAADGRSFGGNSVVSDKESVTLRLSPAPMLGNDSLHLRAHNASLHSSPYVALDGASDDGKSGIVLTTAYGSSVHGGVRGLGLGDMKEDDVDVDALDPVRNPSGAFQNLLEPSVCMLLSTLIPPLLRCLNSYACMHSCVKHFEMHMFWNAGVGRGKADGTTHTAYLAHGSPATDHSH